MRGTILFQTIVLCCLATALPSTVAAESGDADDREALQPGSWALQFGIADNFNLETFEGAVISARRQMSERSVLRLGVSGSFQTSDEERSSTQADTLTSTAETTRDEGSLGLDLHFLRYADPQSRVKFYYGAGPTFGWNRRTAEVTLRDERSGAVAQEEQETSGWWLGLTAVAGVEWFMTDVLSLHAEYGLDGRYLSAHQESILVTGERSSSRDSDTFQISQRSVLFGLSAYF